MTSAPELLVRLLVISTMIMVTGTAGAHPLAPSTLSLVEAGDGSVEMHFRTPTLRPVGADVAPGAPDGCTRLGKPARRTTDVAVEEFSRFDCPGGLAGRAVSVHGLAEAPTNVVWQITLADGTRGQGLLDAARTSFTVPRKPRGLHGFLEYATLGVRHLLTGLDHVLFVLSLLFVVDGRRRLVLAVTAFTLGHTASLALVSLGGVRVPPGPVEIAIAVTLWLSALAMLERHRAGHSGLFQKRPAILSGVFGLVHGLGFAGVLLDAGLPRAAVPVALAGFNVGIELGQLGVLVAALSVLGVVRSVRMPEARLCVSTRLVSAYAIGSIAAMWILERTLGLLV